MGGWRAGDLQVWDQRSSRVFPGQGPISAISPCQQTEGSGCLSLCGGHTEPLSLDSLFSSRWCCGSLGLQLQVAGTAQMGEGEAQLLQLAERGHRWLIWPFLPLGGGEGSTPPAPDRGQGSQGRGGWRVMHRGGPRVSHFLPRHLLCLLGCFPLHRVGAGQRTSRVG